MAEYNKVTVDMGKKFVRAEWRGKPDYTGVEEGCNESDNTLLKFAKGEPLLLVDTRNLDMRFVAPEALKLIEERGAFCLTHCKKVAYLFSSLMLEKQLERTASNAHEKTGPSTGHINMFDDEQEAMKWLLA